MRDMSAANLEAFTQRLGTMRPKLHRYCARMTGSMVDGEDVVQDAMIKALQASFPGARVSALEPVAFIGPSLLLGVVGAGRSLGAATTELMRRGFHTRRGSNLLRARIRVHRRGPRV